MPRTMNEEMTPHRKRQGGGMNMFIISTMLYMALTVIFVPILIVLIYMLATSVKYNDVINAYGISSSGLGALFTIFAVGYLFLTGLCIGELPLIWKDIMFLACLAIGLIVAVAACKVIRVINRDRIQYGDIVIADQKIEDKIIACTRQIDELQATMNRNGIGGTAASQASIRELRELVTALTKMHQDLQQQKIMLNAKIGGSAADGVKLSTMKQCKKALNRQADRIELNKHVDSPCRDVAELMSKYNI